MRILVLLLITLLCCGACKEQYDHKGKTALVEVDGNFLYKEDLMSVLPVGLSKDDSILFAEHYIRSWAEEILLYEKAANNIQDNVDVDKLVENYRKALIMHTYQQELINQKLTSDISEQEIADYYEKNKDLFKLESPLIKGLFIKVPLTELTEQQHREALENGFGKQVIQGYSNVIAALKQGYASIGYERGRNVLVSLNKFLVNKRMIVKEGKGYRYNPDFHY